MGAETKIEWTDATWNPIRGCSRVSAGCENCYAEQVARRFAEPGQPYEGLVRIGKDGKPRAQWNGTIRLVPEHLVDPLRWRRPRRIFVNSMSDLFHERVPFEYIAAVFGVMAAARQHVFQVLTKRPERAREFFDRLGDAAPGAAPMGGVGDRDVRAGFCTRAAELLMLRREPSPRLLAREFRALREAAHWCHWPLPNVWLGVSVEDQQRADERIPHLLACRDLASVLFVSYEPAIGPVNFAQWLPGGVMYRADMAREIEREGWAPGPVWDPGGPRLDWIIIGGESGPGARPFDLAWARSTIKQCRAAGVPAFTKQLGARPYEVEASGLPDLGEDPGLPVRIDLALDDRKGGEPSEWPEDLRVREWPEVRS